MLENEPRPVVSVVEDGGVWQITASPVTVMRGLRNCIDPMRDVGLNLLPTSSPNYVQVSVSPQQEETLMGALMKFRDVEVVTPAA